MGYDSRGNGYLLLQLFITILFVLSVNFLFTFVGNSGILEELKQWKGFIEALAEFKIVIVTFIYTLENLIQVNKIQHDSIMS